MSKRSEQIKLPVIFGKKLVKRDQNGRKMTQKGAIHAKNLPKQPNRSKLSQHDRVVIYRLSKKERIRQEDEEDAKFRKVIVK